MTGKMNAAMCLIYIFNLIECFHEWLSAPNNVWKLLICMPTTYNEKIQLFNIKTITTCMYKLMILVKYLTAYVKLCVGVSNGKAWIPLKCIPEKKDTTEMYSRKVMHIAS